MRLFWRRRKKDEEDEREVEEKEKKPRARRSKKEAPWGRRQRFFVFLVFIALSAISGFLALTARNFKLPHLPRLDLDISGAFEETVEIKAVKRTPAAFSDRIAEYNREMNNIVDGLSGVYSVYLTDLGVRSSSVFEFGFNDSNVLLAASLIKLPVIAAAYQEVEAGRINLNEKYTLTEADKTPGSGSLAARSVGTKVTYGELLSLMGKESDNTAFTIMVTKLGQNKINEVARNIGMTMTNLESNKTTARDVGLFFKKLWKGELVNEANRELILESLTETWYEETIPKAIPEGIRVAHKYGREVHVINDAGIIYTDDPFVLVIMSDGIIEKEAMEAIPQIVKFLYNKML